MQNIQSSHRNALCRVIVLLLLIPGVSGFAFADPATNPSPAVTPAKTAAKAQPAKTSAAQVKKATPATAKTDQTTVVLAPIIVTAATRDPQPVDTTATSSTVIDNQELAQQHDANAVDALSTVPGLTMAVRGTPGQAVSVFSRGTDSASTLLTIDGRRQAPDISNFYDFANLTLDNVDRIEDVRTPSSSLQGGNTIGGVINLVTLTGRGLDRPESSVAFEAGSFDTFREMAQSRGAEEGFDYSVGFSRQDSHFPRANNDYSNTVYRGNFGYTITPTVYVDVQSSYTTSDAGSPGPTNFPDPTADLFRETWNISPRITAQVTDFYTTTLYYNRTQLRQVYSDYYNFSHNRTQTDTDSIDWQNDFQMATHWKITAGIQGDNQKVTDFDDIAGATDIQNSLANIGGYVQSQWEALPGLNILSSIRYDHYSDFDGALSWRQGVAYRVPETETLLHGSASSSYRPPTVADLYYPPFFGFPTSNPNLKPETSLGWEVGAAQPLWGDRLNLSATYFHNNIDDLITSNAGTNYVPYNIGSATTEGVELGVDARITDRLDLNVNYTYLDAMDNTDHTRLTERPRDTTNFTAIWTPLDPVTLTMGGTWVVDRDSSPGVPQEDYFVLRASATWKINEMFSVWVRGENILNESYAVYANYPSLGAGGYGGVKVSF